MITVPTTLVLGAGASVPYGFPSGYELRKKLCDFGDIRRMSPYGYDERDLKIFCDTFLKSGMHSIDAFLARRGNEKVGSLTNMTFADIGKAAIAYCLINCERPEVLHNFIDDHWYSYLWSFMNDSLESFGQNKLKIITFNYDRSLEFYLLTALQNSFGISEEVAAQHLKKIPIIHAYGKLAELTGLAEASMESRTYRAEAENSAYISAAVRGIRVIDESRDDDAVFEQAYSYLSDAQKICFLGFGFDETNFRRLRVEQLMQYYRKERSENAPEIFATTLGMQTAERNWVINKLNATGMSAIYNPAKENIASHGELKNQQYLRATGVFINS